MPVIGCDKVIINASFDSSGIILWREMQLSMAVNIKSHSFTVCWFPGRTEDVKTMTCGWR